MNNKTKYIFWRSNCYTCRKIEYFEGFTVRLVEGKQYLELILEKGEEYRFWEQ